MSGYTGYITMHWLLIYTQHCNKSTQGQKIAEPEGENAETDDNAFVLIIADTCN
jgi:hypothetical protein